MKITARVPMRIDLAGGTLDVYPLYIFEGGGLTVNAAIDVMASATVETRADSRIRIRSLDLDHVEEIPSLNAMDYGAPLDLVRRALAYSVAPPSRIAAALHELALRVPQPLERELERPVRALLPRALLPERERAAAQHEGVALRGELPARHRALLAPPREFRVQARRLRLRLRRARGEELLLERLPPARGVLRVRSPRLGLRGELPLRGKLAAIRRPGPAQRRRGGHAVARE